MTTSDPIELATEIMAAYVANNAVPRIDLPAVVLDIVLGSGGAPPGGLVADVGCGNGAYLAELAAREVACRVIGMDLSPGMLAAAAARGAGACALVNADGGRTAV